MQRLDRALACTGTDRNPSGAIARGTGLSSRRHNGRTAGHCDLSGHFGEACDFSDRSDQQFGQVPLLHAARNRGSSKQIGRMRESFR
jgi:hypothetical protein